MSGSPRRSPYQGASILFAAVIILFALGGIAKTLLDGDGIVSDGFLVSALFLLLGAGRLYLGLRPESGIVRQPGTEPDPLPPPERRPRSKPSRPPLRRRRP